mmetsp:Transcript_9364/g.16942  ORF Transcript_9364/g.16942 Transcript_9364/m.16942 type:complete len:276 (+) Transcript_9364:137-964(+)
MEYSYNGRTCRYWRKKPDPNPHEEELPEPEEEQVANSKPPQKVTEACEDNGAILDSLRDERPLQVPRQQEAEERGACTGAKVESMTERLNSIKALYHEKVHQAKTQLEEERLEKEDSRLGTEELCRQLDDPVDRVAVVRDGCCTSGHHSECAEVQLAALEEKLRLQEEEIQHLQACLGTVLEECAKIERRQCLQSLAMQKIHTLLSQATTMESTPLRIKDVARRCQEMTGVAEDLLESAIRIAAASEAVEAPKENQDEDFVCVDTPSTLFSFAIQ